MSKPDMFSFMPQPKALKESRAVKEIKNITWRISISQWESLVGLTTSERLKFQTYLDQLVQEDFERRGLRWPD